MLVRISGTSGAFQVRFAGGQTAELPFNIPPSGGFFLAGNETQQITNQRGDQNGSFRISFRTSVANTAFQTAEILSFAPATDVQAALELLPNIGAGNVLVDGPDGGPYVITFVEALANKNFPLMTVQNVGNISNFQVQALQDGSISGSATSSLENALNSLPSKPADLR